MSDSYTINIQPGSVSIVRLSDSTTLLSSGYNYLTYDPTGSVIWPVSPTISSSGGNLTWQLNGQQIVLNNVYYSPGATTFDTYIVPMKALNPTITADNFTDYQADNQEFPYRSL
jgi:hypothetical protein